MSYGPPPTYDPTDVMGRRITAWFIDVFIPAAIALAVGWTIFVGSATKFSPEPGGYCTEIHFQQSGVACVQLGNDVYVGTSDDAHHAVEVGGLIFLIGAVNLFVIQGLTGAAIGKHMLGLRVVRQDGSIAGFGWNALRTLLLVVDEVFCALPGIITAGVTHPHRRVGDFAAGTFVVGKDSVGTPIGGSAGSYPPPWTPPGGPVGWGPPPGGAQPWGAPAPGWGSPPAQSPAPTQAPTATPTWGTPTATPPPAQTPSGWGTPVPDDPPAPQPAQPPPAQAPSRREPQWDAQRNAWVFWEVETSRWLQHDPVTGQWGPLR